MVNKSVRDATVDRPSRVSRSSISPPHPRLTTSVVLLTDVISLILGFELSGSVIWHSPHTPVDTVLYFVLFPLAYAFSGLYPGVGIRPHEELKKLTISTTLIHLAIAASAFLSKSANDRSRGALIIAWILALFLVPLGRTITRSLFAKRSWWGVPVLLLGAKEEGQLLAKRLIEQPGMGFKPVAIFDDNPNPHVGLATHLPIYSPLAEAPKLARQMRIKHAILCLPESHPHKMAALLQKLDSTFPYVIVVPGFFDSINIWITARDLGGLMGLEIKHNLLFASSQVCKRSIDLILTIAGGLTILPFLILIALLIKLDSRGSIFYAQERMGINGSRFQALKFRSMHENAEVKLQQILTEDHELRQEYEVFHKLRHDPRVTRLGRFLRKYSLDELPQIWNVIKGDMSLVGPRAYMPSELEKMNSSENMILRVLPGITGLWQVRGRNNFSFQERLDIDVYYVRNWSLSLDLYLLVSTIRVVLMGKGAF
ncbi:Undecaprenyl-phosphate galactose phosphotransferase, WbaP [Thalassoporum mexicanum PCC 7367]|uniref:undecaprenyl-phosphate galactose phosphotransferase WbaP n=1 Tax=Thalassoporum mexicanum TaxID=3457544 RepID=UPI00029FFF2B|nr:undecaprenyl-phosphate galactose phosphotransferase WbaP [Pseudanabaena sp. PCC 7367]AFY68684.1 Undecaprenyl-phosphate galactose phosphotransferase, WbaP [Pseudanabaena sp. PCC 7367]